MSKQEIKNYLKENCRKMGTKARLSSDDLEGYAELFLRKGASRRREIDELLVFPTYYGLNLDIYHQSI